MINESKTFNVVFWTIFCAAAFLIIVVWGSMLGFYYHIGHRMFSEGCTPTVVSKHVGNEEQLFVKCISDKDAVK